MSINRVTISGNLGRDPELKATAHGMRVLRFSMCVNSRVKRDGEWVDKANWVDVAFFGSRAESLSRYLQKGSHVTVAGRLNQNTWETKDSQRRSKLEVIGDDIDFSGGKRDEQQAQRHDEPPADIYDEDIPF